jgi:hypothetical protein
MAVTSQVPLVRYVAGGGADFSFPFRIPVASHLKVFVAGTEVVSGYSLVGVGDPAGGTLTFAVAPAPGTQILLARQTPIERSSDYVEGGALRASELDDDFDALTYMVQDIRADAITTTEFQAIADQIEADRETAKAAAAIAIDRAAAALTSQNAANASATGAAASAASALADRTTATTQAGIATTQAGIATTGASTATTLAGIATAQAGSATTSATTATTQAGIATTQAGIATTQAGSATSSATAATTQAGIAVTKAAEAAASAAAAAASVLGTSVPLELSAVSPGEVFATAASVTLNTGYAAGIAFGIMNNSAAQINIIQGSGLTLRLAGTAATGSRTLAARGLVWVYALSTTEYYTSGGGIG